MPAKIIYVLALLLLDFFVLALPSTGYSMYRVWGFCPNFTKGPLSRGTPYNFFLGIGCLQGTQETLDLPLVDRWPYWPFSSKAPLKIFSNPIKTFHTN